MKNQSITINLNSWNDLLLLSQKLDTSFVYRGQSNSKWTLSSSLERAINKYSPDIFGFLFLGNKEYWMLHEFKRKYPLYSNNLPDKNDKFEWLSILQHYGAPTRLLDFTHSIYIAAYFAACESNEDCSIYCINLISLRKKALEKFDLNFPKNSLKDTWNRKFIEIANITIDNLPNSESTGFVLPIVPERTTHRLSFQQGLFLMPQNSNQSFMDNLKCTFKDHDDSTFENMPVNEIENPQEKYDVIKIIIPAKLTTEISRELFKMNITAETLFPGLDGLAKSFLQQQIRDYI